MEPALSSGFRDRHYLQAENTFLIKQTVQSGSADPEPSLYYSVTGVGCSCLPMMSAMCLHTTLRLIISSYESLTLLSCLPTFTSTLAGPPWAWLCCRVIPLIVCSLLYNVKWTVVILHRINYWTSKKETQTLRGLYGRQLFIKSKSTYLWERQNVVLQVHRALCTINWFL